ncbi:MAG: hypothetical protein IPH83_19080 [Gammaproteobacteria bacterium]|nr:hypothetical protein [Gammaproteobacteria bacterium]
MPRRTCRRRTLIPLRAERLDTMLGVSLPSGDVEDIPRRLGLGVECHGAGWLVQSAELSLDIRIEVDPIEEIARVHGYDRVPACVQSAAVPIRPRAGRRSTRWSRGATA